MSTTQLANHTNKDSMCLCDHEYYGPLIDSYIKCILKSGLLLDEDLEVLLSFSKLRNFPDGTGYKPSLMLLTSLISIIGSSVLATKLKMPLLLIPSTTISLYVAIAEFKNKRRKEDNKIIIDKLTATISKIQKIHKNIIIYMKTRYDLGIKDQNTLLLSGRNVEEFMKEFVNNNSTIFHFLINNLKVFTKHSQELKEDFVILEHLNSSNIFGKANENVNDIENCLVYSQKIYDINVLVFSKLLTYIGITINSHLLAESDFNMIINKIFPNIVKTLQKHNDVTKEYFVSLRHATNKKSEIKSKNETGKRKNISSKLETTLISTINNLSVILEKSQNILEKLEDGNDHNIPTIGKEIIDLRNHTYATYETLDILCKFYGILSNFKVPETTDQSNRSNKTGNSSTISLETVPTVNYNDDSEPIEEKFELYIENDESSDDNPTTEYEGESNVYLSLMLQELKQSLKKHERFIEAKNKRGVEDEDDLNIEKITKPSQSPPKFNLELLRCDPNQKQILEDFTDEHKASESESDLPAPPPPPLPSFQHNDLEEETGQINTRSMLENIKMLSSQRDVQEDVFGDSGEDVDSDD